MPDEYTVSDVLKTAFKFKTILQEQREEINQVLIGDTQMTYASYLIHLIEAYLYKICNINRNILRRFFTGFTRLFTRNVNITIFLDEFNQLLIEMHDDAVTHNRLKERYILSGQSLTLLDLAVIITHAIIKFQLEGKLPERFVIKYDFRELEKTLPIPEFPADLIKTIDIPVKGISVEVPKTPILIPQAPPRLPPPPRASPTPSISNAIEQVGAMLGRFNYVRFRNSTAREMVRDGHGDCWAMAEFVHQQLCKRRVRSRIINAGVRLTPNHRWVRYWDGNNWVNFPMRRFNRHWEFLPAIRYRNPRIIAQC